MNSILVMTVAIIYSAAGIIGRKINLVDWHSLSVPSN